MKFSIKDFSSKCDQIRRKLRIWSHLLEKSLMENFIFCTVLKQILHFMCLNPSTDSNDEFIYLIAFYKDQMFTTKTRWRFQLADLNGHRENSPIYIEEGVLQNRTPSSIQLHPAHFNLHPAHFNVQPAHFNVQPAPSTSTQLISTTSQLSATPSTIFKPKYRT